LIVVSANPVDHSKKLLSLLSPLRYQGGEPTNDRGNLTHNYQTLNFSSNFSIWCRNSPVTIANPYHKHIKAGLARSEFSRCTPLIG
jgi:hypothetical protein